MTGVGGWGVCFCNLQYKGGWGVGGVRSPLTSADLTNDQK